MNELQPSLLTVTPLDAMRVWIQRRANPCRWDVELFIRTGVPQPVAG